MEVAPDPIMVDCVGAGCAPIAVGYTTAQRLHGMCSCCGCWYCIPEDGDSVVPEHRRQDIIAMIDRGDFG